MYGAICYILAVLVLDWLAHWWPVPVVLASVLVGLFIVAIVAVGKRYDDDPSTE